jgi:hypothetical protein
MTTDLARYRAALNGSDSEEVLAFQLKAAGIGFERQYPWPLVLKEAGRPFPTSPTGKPRRWTSDFYVGRNLLVEIDGQVWHKGGHTSGQGYTDDREKDSEALCAGYRTLRVTGAQVESGIVLTWIERLLAGVDSHRD